MKKAFIYVRVSTQEQINGYSIGEQQERLEAYAKARGYTVIGKYIDPGYSAANTDRPALQEMIKNINNADVVIVYKLDRLSRSQRDTMHLIEDVFLKNDINFVSVNESFDTSTSFGIAMVGILSVFAQLEREQTAERSMMGKLARAKEGYYHGGGESKVPKGYDYIEGELIINHYERECVKYIFERYMQGISINKLFKEVIDRFPGVIVNPSTISYILKNSTYIGKVKYKKQEYEGKHEPIIDEDTFNKVQALRKKRSVKSNNFKGNYLLSGLVWCGCCGARLHGRTGTKLKDGYKRYYSCYTRRGFAKHMMSADKCDKKNEPKENMEELIVNSLKGLTLEEVENKMKENNNIDLIMTLEKELEEVNKQVSKMIELFTVESMPIDILNEKVKVLNSNKQKLENRIEELKEESEIDIEELEYDIKMIDEFDDLEFEEKKMLLSRLIDKITVTEEKVVVDWTFARCTEN